MFQTPRGAPSLQWALRKSLLNGGMVSFILHNSLSVWQTLCVYGSERDSILTFMSDEEDRGTCREGRQVNRHFLYRLIAL